MCILFVGILVSDNTYISEFQMLVMTNEERGLLPSCPFCKHLIVSTITDRILD